MNCLRFAVVLGCIAVICAKPGFVDTVIADSPTPDAPVDPAAATPDAPVDPDAATPDAPTTTSFDNEIDYFTNALEFMTMLAGDALLEFPPPVLEYATLGNVAMLGTDQIQVNGPIDIKSSRRITYVTAPIQVGPMKVVPADNLEHDGLATFSVTGQLRIRIKKSRYSGPSVSYSYVTFDVPDKTEVIVSVAGSFENLVYLEVIGSFLSNEVKSLITVALSTAVESPEAYDVITAQTEFLPGSSSLIRRPNWTREELQKIFLDNKNLWPFQS